MSSESRGAQEAMNRYLAGGLAGDLVPGHRPALIVVDLQKGFTDPAGGPGFEMTNEVRASAALVDAAHAAGVPVYFTTIAFGEHENPVWLAKMPAMKELRPGSEWVAIDPATGIEETDVVVVKQAASAFSGTDLHEQLQAKRVDTVVVCGATTSGCIRATAVDAISLGYRPFVVDGAVADRERAPHDAALFDIQAKYGEVVSVETARSLLEQAERLP